MAGTRRDIVANTVDRDQFLRGVAILDEPNSGIFARDVFQFLQNNLPNVRMRGIDQELSIYDLFVLWHVVAMSFPMPPGNAAHSAPVFLPWHRMYLIRLEEQLQRVLGDPNFGLPYWDWASDGEFPVGVQRQRPIWSSNILGQSRGNVLSGAVGEMRVRLWHDGRSTLWSVNPRPIFREAGIDTARLPRQSDVTAALDEPLYDQPPWSDSQLAVGHRNRLEGWINGPQLHNLVHVWIGGDMGPPTSPNDPAFFLNHCNVDRIWESWMGQRGRVYEPAAGQGPTGHRINDLMVAILGEPLRPQNVLNPAQWYEYDTLSVD